MTTTDSWSISAEGVVAVLKATNPDAETLGATFTGISTTIGTAVTATQSAAIGQALQSYFTMRGEARIKNINTRIGAAVQGVVNATQAYVNGDVEMAAQSQRAAHDLVYPPLPPRSPHGIQAIA